MRLDIRPLALNGLSSKIKFLVVIETGSGSDEMTGMGCSFVLDVRTKQLTQNVLRLQCNTAIYLGKLDYKNPAILFLNQDMRSLIVYTFEDNDPPDRQL